jgi:DHA1 family multidrug resistance protein-like MFS transporter
MTELGLLFSMSNAAAAIMQILSGFLSDKYGRKRLHSLGILLAAFPPLMYALANNWIDLVPWVLLSGFAIGLYVPIRWTMVADISPTEKMASAYGLMNISWLLGFTVGPFLGGLVADFFGIRFPFFASFALMLSVFPLTLLIRETKKQQLNALNAKSVKAGVANGYMATMIIFSTINIIQGLGVGVTGPVIPVFAISNFHVDYTFVGVLYAIGFGVASIVVQIPGGKCSDLFDRRKVMATTFIASSPFFLLLVYSRNMLELIVFMFLSNAIFNFSWPAFQTLMMDATPSSRWGFINGISATTFWLGETLGAALSGILWDSLGMLAPFYASFFAIGFSAILPLLLKETRSN